MTDLATITGIIGTITGAIALIVSIKTYMRVSAMKALDLRLEIDKAFNNLGVAMSDIEGFLDRVHQSHIRVLAATGRNQSGEMKLFEEEFTNDRTRLKGLLKTQPKRETTYDRHSPGDLENILMSVHALHVQIADMRSQYQRIFDSDDEHRKEIRADHRS